jgi:outer membrane receptor protein involved in Fe transport
MKIRLLSLIIVVLLAANKITSQNANLSGQITEDGTQDVLFGVNIIIDPIEKQDNDEGIQLGTTSDFDGKYSIDLKPGTYNVKYNYIGYKEINKKIILKPGAKTVQNIGLIQDVEVISEVVVSAGRFEQNLSEVTVSMAVMKAKSIENNNIFNMDQAINQIPAVDVNDGQISIRSSSGWSYGAGSRVMVLMDDLPILSGDAGDVKFSYIPIENVSQVEVVKGASSVLFGSSAIGGVINIRSAYPTDKPQTKISYFSGVYANPPDEGFIWWERAFFSGNDSRFAIPFREELFYWVKNPMYGGLSFHHAQQFDNLDLSMGGNHFIQEGFRKDNSEKRSRFNSNIRYRSKKIQGLAAGINTNFMAIDGTDFFMWDNADNPYVQSGGGEVIPRQGFRVNLDPFAYYYAPNGSKYSLRTRFLSFSNNFPTDTTKNSIANTYYGEYQYQTLIQERINLASGVVYSYSTINSTLFGDHYSENLALYSQADLKYGNLRVSLGLRGEYFIVDTAQTESMIDIRMGKDTLSIPIKPVFRTGINYHLFSNTHIRASLGQGYRFPSIAEKYTNTGLGIVNVFPNPKLTAETSWSGEVGIMQGFKLPAKWMGHIDAAFFIQDIYNMMEFTFGFFDTETFESLSPGSPVTMDNMGFQSQNVGDVRILGSEINLTAGGKLGPFMTTILAGYTYTYPTNRDDLDTTASSLSPILKYRYRHSFKTDLNFEAKRLTFGVNIIYKSAMENVDRLFCDERDPETVHPNTYNTYRFLSQSMLPGYWDYRLETAHKSVVFIDTRIGFKFSESLRASFLVKNLFNTMYVGRPGDMLPPRRFEIQLSANF